MSKAIRSLLLILLAASLFAQTAPPSTSKTGTTKSKSSTAAKKKKAAAPSEAQMLRKELAEQQQQIQQLRDEAQRRDAAMRQMEQQLSALQSTAQQAQSAAQSASSATDHNTTALQQVQTSVAELKTTGASTAAAVQTYEKRITAASLQAGWNGSHFFIQSPDKKFLLQPFGYLQSDYHGYAQGEGTPTNYFQLRRARVGFTGHYGKHYSFGFLVDFGTSGFGPTISTPPLRDYYLNVEVVPEAQFKFGQWITPFSQEANHSSADLEFVERSVADVLVPNYSSLRSLGVDFHGEAFGSRAYYDLGVFDGKGVVTAPKTNTPEAVFRLGFRPWRHNKDSVLQGLDFYGALSQEKTAATITGTTATTPSGEITITGEIPNRAVTIFPTLVLNGSLLRTDGGLTYLKGPLAIRGEYIQVNAARRDLGTGGADLPGLVAKGYYAQATYVLTGETRPLASQPTPRHPFLMGEKRGAGAWEAAFRYASLQFAAGSTENRLDAYSAAIDWYPTKLIKWTVDVDVDHMRDPRGTLLPQNFVVVLQRLQFKF